MTRRILAALDATSHRILDRYIDHQFPGWGRVQLWQWHLCNAYERTYFEGDER